MRPGGFVFGGSQLRVTQFTNRVMIAKQHAGLWTPNGAGWSSPVARQAHNLKVVGSNPTPATKPDNKITQRHHTGDSSRQVSELLKL